MNRRFGIFRSSITNFITAAIAVLMTGLFVAALILAMRDWDKFRVAVQIARLTDIDRALFDAQVETRAQVPVDSMALIEQDDPRSVIDERARQTSLSLEKALAVLARSDVPGRDTMAAQIREAAQHMAGLIRQPLDQALLPRERRSLLALDAWRSSVHELIDALSVASSSVHGVVRRADARIGELVDVREAAWTIRDRYGLQCSALRPNVETNQPLGEGARDGWIGDRAVYTAAWKSLDALLAEPGGSGALARLAATARAQTTAAQERIDRVIAQLGRNARAPVTDTQWTNLCDGPFAATLAIAREAQREASERADSLRSDSFRILLVAAVDVTAVVAFGVAALVVVRRRFARPMRQLIASIDRLSRRQYDKPVPGTDSPDELGAMAMALETLRAGAIEAERLQQAMNRFTSDASHQMRTPLTILRSHLAVLESLIEPGHAGRASLLDLRDAADRLQRLLIQLLKLARAEAPPAEEGALTDLAEVAADTAREFVQPALEAGIDLHFEADAAPCPSRISRIVVHEILSNLIDNAIRYNHGGGHVVVRLRRDGAATLVVEVEDDGPGIPEEEWPRVTTRFYRLPRDQQRPGSGLGLAIVDSLVSSIGGRLARVGRPGAVGLIVRVEIPL